MNFCARRTKGFRVASLTRGGRFKSPRLFRVISRDQEGIPLQAASHIQYQPITPQRSCFTPRDRPANSKPFMRRERKKALRSTLGRRIDRIATTRGADIEVSPAFFAPRGPIGRLNNDGVLRSDAKRLSPVRCQFESSEARLKHNSSSSSLSAPCETDVLVAESISSLKVCNRVSHVSRWSAMGR